MTGSLFKSLIRIPFKKHSLSAESQQMVEDASIMVYQQVAKQEEMKYVST
jgi:hypothetical protein